MRIRFRIRELGGQGAANGGKPRIWAESVLPTLLRLESDDVYHFGNVPEGCHGPATNSLISGFEGAGDLVAGDFTHRDHSRYVLVVNKDVYKSVYFAPRFRTPPKRVWHVSSYTGELAGFEGEQRWLAPGQGMLLKVE